jgi:acetolactate decarboxylase
MKILIFPVAFLILFTACKPAVNEDDPDSMETAQETEKNDGLFHYSIWWALVNLIYDGELSAESLKEKGDIALGSYNGLSGELVMVDGRLFKVNEEGTVYEPEDDELICYANAAWFDPDRSYEIDGPIRYDSLRSNLSSNFPSNNQFYGLRIHGDFAYMKCGGVPEQEKPYEQGLDVLLPNRPVYERENFTGTMVGFYCPDFIGNINVAGFHLHFISDDATFGGHVMEFDASKLEVGIDFITEYTFVLPETEEYLFKGSFDREFQYGTK